MNVENMIQEFIVFQVKTRNLCENCKEINKQNTPIQCIIGNSKLLFTLQQHENDPTRIRIRTGSNQEDHVGTEFDLVREKEEFKN